MMNDSNTGLVDDHLAITYTNALYVALRGVGGISETPSGRSGIVIAVLVWCLSWLMLSWVWMHVVWWQLQVQRLSALSRTLQREA